MWESADAVVRLIWRTRTQSLRRTVQVGVVRERSMSWNQPDFETLKAWQMTAVPTKTGGCVRCVCVCTSGFEVLVTVERKQKRWPCNMAALNWLNGHSFGQSSDVFPESSLHSGGAARRSECDWHFMGAYWFTSGVSVKTPGMLWNAFLVLQPVFILCTLCNLSKVCVNRSKHLFNEVLLMFPDDSWTVRCLFFLFLVFLRCWL